MHGSYDSLVGGFPNESLTDLTGGIAETFRLPKPVSKQRKMMSTIAKIVSGEKIFRIISQSIDRQALCGCTTGSEKERSLKGELNNKKKKIWLIFDEFNFFRFSLSSRLFDCQGGHNHHQTQKYQFFSFTLFKCCPIFLLSVCNIISFSDIRLAVKVKLFCIRNPWGFKAGWKGPYCEG